MMGSVVHGGHVCRLQCVLGDGVQDGFQRRSVDFQQATELNQLSLTIKL